MDYAAEIKHLVKATKEFVEPKADGVVIGLSGGIDSSVVAALCVKALGKDNVFGVYMPCDSNSQDRADAELIVDSIDFDCRAVELDNTMHYTVLQTENALCFHTNKLTQGNIKARLRMTILYAIASEKNYLVVGTGNKSEILTGYFTKYGDGGVDFEPIGAYYKTEVFALATALNMPQQIIDKKPSAGLWDGQTDEEDLGMTYEELDNILTWGEDTPEKIEKVDKLIKSSRHKRNVPPIIERKPRGIQ